MRYVGGICGSLLKVMASWCLKICCKVLAQHASIHLHFFLRGKPTLRDPYRSDLVEIVCQLPVSFAVS